MIATGSSALELSSRVNEPLTGRKYEFMLYYPEIVTKPAEEKELLRLLADSYLYKDLLTLEQVKKPILLEKMLRAFALQIGNEVNYNELAQTIGANRLTVEKYIDLLAKAFVVFVLPALNRNVRNEIKKGKKVYFYDCGIRNAIINNFSPLGSRTDVGGLWENYIIAERMKFLHYNRLDAKQYFWRTTQQQEIDLIEEHEGGALQAFEFKWGKTGKRRIPQTFTANYPRAETFAVSPENIQTFLLRK